MTTEPVIDDSAVILAYADGSDLHDIAPSLRDQLQRLVNEQQWNTLGVKVVELRGEPDPAFPDCLPDWDLGINLGIDHPGWFTDVEQLVRSLWRLNKTLGRDFVVCLLLRDVSERQEHLCFIGDSEPDVTWLRAAIQRLARRAD